MTLHRIIRDKTLRTMRYHVVFVPRRFCEFLRSRRHLLSRATGFTFSLLPNFRFEFSSHRKFLSLTLFQLYTMNFDKSGAQHLEQGLPRRAEKYRQWQQEMSWFSERFERPPMSDHLWNKMCQDMAQFRQLISENEASRMLPQFASTPDELAVLCGQGSAGWLLSSHIVWALDQVNLTSKTAVGLCLNSATVNDLRGLQRQRSLQGFKRVIFVVNVGVGAEGTFVASSSRSGCHWALAVVDITVRALPTVLYCDSLGWECPSDLGQKMAPFLSFLGCGAVRPTLTGVAHVPGQGSGQHVCTPLCLNYPVQTCGNVCGVITLIAAVIAAKSDGLFQKLTSPRCDPLRKMYLHDPTRYERYFRRVVMTWFSSSKVTLDFIHVAAQTPGSTSTRQNWAGTKGQPKQAPRRSGHQKEAPTMSGHQKEAPPMTGHQKKSPPMSSHQKEALTMSGHQKKSPPMSGHQKEAPPMSSHQKEAPTMSGHQKEAPPMTGHQKKSPPMSSHQKEALTMSGHQKKSPPMSGHQKEAPPMSSHQKEAPTMSGHQKEAPPMTGHQKKSPPMSSHQKEALTMSGHQKKSPPMSGHQKEAPPMSSHQKEAPTMSGHQKEAPTMTGHQKKSPPMSGHQKEAPTMSSHQKEAPTMSGHQKEAPPMTGHQKKSPPMSGHQKKSPLMSGHQKQPSSTSGNDNQPPRPPLPKKERTCPYCLLTLSRRDALVRHIKKHHPGKDIPHTERTCHCQSCDYVAYTVNELVQHYNIVHEKNFKIEKQTFNSREEFESWRSKTEKDTKSCFVKQRGYKSSTGYITDFYYCNRSAKGSGKMSSKNQGKRHGKIQGSSKISGKCTCHMTVTQYSDSGKVTVVFCFNHIGHGTDLCHLKLSFEVRSFIVAKLSAGVETSKILSDIRDKFDEVDRDTLLTRKDIQNIQRQYKISHSQKDANDAISVQLWVEELKQGNDNPIIYVKTQGQTDSSTNLHEDDFLLCIQTPFQKEMMKCFCGNMLFIDSTHSTTQYQFLLTTILVTDEFGEAIPVAWALSNREDNEILEVFMRALKVANNGEDYHTRVFMSDLASAFYNAWCTIFSVPDKRLYCTWHVDKAWKKKLKELITDKTEQVEMYAYLYMLRNEVEEGQFRKKITEFAEYTREQYPQFHSYFQNTYVTEDKVKFWAACFRRGCFANTNMYAEAFHRVLKDIYFQRKQNKRVDALLFVLLKVSRDKACEQLIKCEKGKITHRMREIRNRHRSAIDLKDIQASTDNDSEWIVPSTEMGPDIKYYVTKMQGGQKCQCKQGCTECHVCPHMFSCTCADFLTRIIPCKHIHAVQIKQTTNTSTPVEMDEDEAFDNESDIHTVNETYFKPFICKDEKLNSSDIRQLQTDALRAVNKLIDLINNTTNIDALKSIITNVSAAVTVGRGFEAIEASQQRDFEVREQFLGNKHFQTQKSLVKFFSTKRKSGRKRLKLSKPDSNQIKILSENLSQVTASICAICFCKEDNGTGDEILWQQCTSCQGWLHAECDKTAIVGDDYDCKVCRGDGEIEKAA